MAKVTKRKSATRKPKPSKLITKSNYYAMKPNAKNIIVTSIAKNGSMKNRYIKNTEVNRKQIIALKGKPDDFWNGRYVWM